MTSREASLKSSVWNGRENEIRPFGNPRGSDSANLDSAAEVSGAGSFCIGYFICSNVSY